MRQYKLISLLALLILVSSQASMAQFKVLASSGMSKINTTPAKVGIPISATDNITVSPQAYISLLHTKTGGTVEISKAGTYQAATLEKELLKKASSSTSARYANYIIGELTKADDKEIHKNPYKYSNVTGSVERDIFQGKIVVQMAKTCPVFGKEYLVQWHHLAGADGYILEIQNDFDEVAKVIETKDTFALVRLDIPELKDTGLAKMIVHSAKDRSISSKEFGLTQPEADSLALLKKEYKALGISNNPSPGERILEAQLFEQYRYYADAMKSYENAIAADPEFEPYRIAFNQFLIRTGIKSSKDFENLETAEK